MKILGIIVTSLTVFCASCASSAASAEEYYSLGLAYYEMGKFEEAGKWFSKASSLKKTMNASEYNLGRIAYETGRYTEAAKHFEKLIKLDPENVMALKSAAYTAIMLGNLEKADTYYARVLRLEPESADSGYNHALVLYAMKRYPEAEELLNKYGTLMPENKTTLLLLARSQQAQNKIEAIDSYALWLANNTDPFVRYEYVGVLEAAQYYARAIEETRKTITEMSSDLQNLKKADVQFKLAELLLTTDPQNEAGIAELRIAVSAGFSNKEAFAALLKDERITKINKTEIQEILSGIDAAPPATQ